MPLVSFAFTGWWAGQAPSSLASTQGDVLSTLGWGGNGNGCGSQPTVPGVVRDDTARQIA
jgi:hypothetical protein